MARPFTTADAPKRECLQCRGVKAWSQKNLKKIQKKFEKKNLKKNLKKKF